MDKEYLLSEATKYFKSNEGYKRLFIKLKKQYEIYDANLPGNVILENPSSIEKETISGFMKKSYYKNKTISINLKKFQERLNETRFNGLTTKEILEKYFNVSIITNKIKKNQKGLEFEAFLHELLNFNKSKLMYEVLNYSVSQKNKLYSTIKILYFKDVMEAKEILNNLFLCVNELELLKEKTSIPVYSALKLKSPHGLDKDTFIGKLFIQVLTILEEINLNTKLIIKSSEELSELYYKYNLLIDEVSNMVLCKNIIAYKGENIHHGWEGFFKNNEAMQVTLQNLSNIDNAKINVNKVLVVENPAVFMAISKIDKNIPIVCTYGQLKLSGIILINLLTKATKNIYYSGDIDPEGIQIALKLKSRYRKHIKLIGFDIDTYKRNLSDIKLSKERLSKLNNIQEDELLDTINEMKKTKKAAYEELNIDNILKLVQDKNI